MTKSLLVSLDEQFSIGLHELPDTSAILRRMLNYGDSKRLHRAHVNLWARLFSIELALTMRHGVERMLSVGDHFGDEAIGADEMREFFAQPQLLEDENGIRHPDSQAWLSALGLPSLEQLTTSQEAYRGLLELIEEHPEIKALLPLVSMRQNFGLSNDDMSILLALAIAYRSERLLRMMTVAWSDIAFKHVTAGFICRMISRNAEHYEELLTCLQDSSCLVRTRLVYVLTHARYPTLTPRVLAPLMLDESVISMLIQGRLPTSAASKALNSKDLIASAELCETLAQSLSSPKARLILRASQNAGRSTLLASIAKTHLDMACRFVNMADIFLEQSQINDGSALLKLQTLSRDVLWEGAILAIKLDGLKQEKLAIGQTQNKEIAEILAFYPGHIVLIEETDDNLARKLFGTDCSEINLPTADKAQQQLAWLSALKSIGQTGDLKDLVSAFVNNYSMGIGEIFRAVNQAKSQQIKKGTACEPLKSHHLLEEIRKAFDHNLDALADVVVSTTTLDDIVLSTELSSEVAEILQYARHANTVLVDWGFEQRSPYGNALSALFTGPPGTGKTYLAGAIANALGKVLYRVDLSRVIDKYIGETEKNLGRIFDEAGRAQAVLLFDEADSLFAKRTEVKSSNDRYANLEVNFLLQRLESYRGVSILTTNLDKGIDDAFKRRLRFLIHFKMPDASERARLWKHLMPPRAPRADEIDWMLLGNQFEMTGGYIRNAILRASIQAASKSEPIHMGHLLMAGIEEMRSTGALIKINYEMSDWLASYGISSGYEQSGDHYYH